MKLFAYLFTVFSILQGTLAVSEEIECYKYPMEIDFKDKFPSAMLIEFKIQGNTPVPLKDLNDDNDKILNAFKSYIVAVEKNSFDNALFGIAPPQKKAEDKLKLIHAIYEKMKTKGEILLVKRIIGNDVEAFLWGPKNENGVYMVCAVSFSKDNGNIMLQWESNTRVSLGILCSMLRSNPALHKADPEQQCEFSFFVKDTTNDMVKFKFNGKRYNLQTDKIPADNTDEVLAFYAKSQNALDLPLEEYAEFFTEKSKGKILDHYKEYPDQKEYLNKRNKQTPKIVRFILNADPVYIVFYRASTHSTDQILDDFDYVVKTRDGLKLTNFGYSDSFNQMLKLNLEEIKKTIYPEEFKEQEKRKANPPQTWHFGI